MNSIMTGFKLLKMLWVIFVVLFMHCITTQISFCQGSFDKQYFTQDAISLIESYQSYLNIISNLGENDQGTYYDLTNTLINTFFISPSCLVFDDTQNSKGSEYISVEEYFIQYHHYSQVNRIENIDFKIDSFRFLDDSKLITQDTIYFRCEIHKTERINQRLNSDELFFYFMVVRNKGMLTSPLIYAIAKTDDFTPPININFLLDTKRNKLNISWDTRNYPGVIYEINITKDNSDDTSSFKSADNNCYLDLDDSDVFYILIRAVDLADSKSELSEKVTYYIPVRPKITKITSDCNQGICIFWNGDISGQRSYKIYRKAVSDTYYHMIGISDSKANFCDSTAKPLVSYQYYIIEKYPDGTESPPSLSRSGNIEIQAVEYLTIWPNLANTQLNLYWEDNNCDRAYYKVFRSDARNSQFRPITSNLDRNYFTDENLEADQKYIYKIQSIDKSTKLIGDFSREAEFTSTYTRKGFRLMGFFNPALTTIINSNFEDDEWVSRIDMKTRINLGLRLHFYFGNSFSLAIGGEDNYYRIEATKDNFSITYHLSYLTIPLCFEFVFGQPNTWNIYIEPGIKYMFLLKHTIQSTDKSLYFTYWDELQDNNLAATLSTGLIWDVFPKRNWWVKSGLYCDYGLMNIGGLNNSSNTYNKELQSTTSCWGLLIGTGFRF